MKMTDEQKDRLTENLKELDELTDMLSDALNGDTEKAVEHLKKFIDKKPEYKEYKKEIPQFMDSPSLGCNCEDDPEITPTSLYENLVRDEVKVQYEQLRTWLAMNLTTLTLDDGIVGDIDKELSTKHLQLLEKYVPIIESMTRTLKYWEV